MQKGLKDKKNPFDGKMKKTELYEIIKLKKPEPVHKTDEFLRGKCHDVLRLPPYHCEYNPIEMVWGDVKGHVGWENKLPIPFMCIEVNNREQNYLKMLFILTSTYQ
jgi:transposase